MLTYRELGYLINNCVSSICTYPCKNIETLGCERCWMRSKIKVHKWCRGPKPRQNVGLSMGLVGPFLSLNWFSLKIFPPPLNIIASGFDSAAWTNYNCYQLSDVHILWLNSIIMIILDYFIRIFIIITIGKVGLFYKD